MPGVVKLSELLQDLVCNFIYSVYIIIVCYNSKLRLPSWESLPSYTEHAQNCRSRLQETCVNKMYKQSCVIWKTQFASCSYKPVTRCIL